ncbi:site-specific integrase [Bacteroidota bacterium]
MVQRDSFAILFYIRNDKPKSTGEVPIFMRLTVNGRRSEMAIHRYVDPEKWNKSGGYAKGTKQEIRELNEFLDLQRNKVYVAQRELMEENKLVTAKALRNRVQGKTEDRKTLVEVFEYHNMLMEETVPAEYSPATLTRYKTTLDHVKAFVNRKYKSDDIFLSQLNHAFISEFYHYFRHVKNCNNNTASKYIRNLKKIVNLAVKNEWLLKDPFDKYSVKINPVQRDFLSEQELFSIENLEIAIDRLDMVRDTFVFSCYTGYAYVDVAKLTRNNLRKGIDGDLWVYLNREKTSTKSNVPLLPKAIEIIEKYEDHPVADEKGTLLPVFSNQNLNAYLKEIAILAGIDKHLTFHLARHTFATLMLTKGVSIETVADMLGHKDIRTTQIYAKVVETKVSEEMNVLKQKLANETSIDLTISKKL